MRLPASFTLTQWASRGTARCRESIIPNPKGPKIEKIQDRPPGLKFSIEIENFKRATQQTPIFVGNSEGPGLKFSEVSKRGWRTEGVGARKSLLHHEFRPFFLPLSPMPPYEYENTILGDQFWLWFGHYWSLTPSRQPLFKTSEIFKRD